MKKYIISNSLKGGLTVITVSLLTALVVSSCSWIEENPSNLVTDTSVGDSPEACDEWVTGTYSKWIKKINFNFTVNNLFTVTKYSWFEPDVNAGGTNAATPGVDSYSYPAARTYALGINFTF